MLLIFISFIYIVAFAHSGRTDENGGHWDNDLGEYHYHCNGYPEHSHINGVCPYKSRVHYKENNSVSSDSDDSEKTYDEGYEKGYNIGKTLGYNEGFKTAYKKGYDNGYDDGLFYLKILICIISAVIVIYWLIIFFKNKNEKE